MVCFQSNSVHKGPIAKCYSMDHLPVSHLQLPTARPTGISISGRSWQFGAAGAAGIVGITKPHVVIWWWTRQKRMGFTDVFAMFNHCQKSHHHQVSAYDRWKRRFRDTHIYIHIQTHARRHLMNKCGRFTNAEIHFIRRNSGTKDKIVEQTKQNSNSLNRLNLERMRMAHTRYFTYTNSYMYGSTVL